MDFILRLDTLDWIVNNCKFVQIQNLKPTQEQLIQNKQDENKHLAVFFYIANRMFNNKFHITAIANA